MRLKEKFEIVTSGNGHRGAGRQNLINESKEGQTHAQGEVSETLKVLRSNPVLGFVCCIPYTSVISCLIVSSTPLVSLSLFLMLPSFFPSTRSPQVVGQSSSELSHANENPMLPFSHLMKTDLEAPLCMRSRLHNMDEGLVQKRSWGVGLEQKTNFKFLQCLISLNPGYLG